MATGENEQGLRKIMDFTRMLSISILAIHIYLACFSWFREIGFNSSITDRLAENLMHTRVFASGLLAKSCALLLLLISLIGVKGRKDEKSTQYKWIVWALIGFGLYLAAI